MNQTELIARVRLGAALPAAHPTWTDTRIIDQLNDALRGIFTDLVTTPREGHWVKQYTFQSTVGMTKQRISQRAVVGGIEKVEIGEIGGDLYALDEVTENHAQYYEGFNGRTDTPWYYVIRGDQLNFLPGFNRAMNVRVTYYIRPSYFVAPQSNPLSSGYVVSSTSTSITMDSMPVYRIARRSFPAGSNLIATSLCDVIHPNGTYELSLAGALISSVSGGGVVLNFPAGTDLSEVQVGDYVRADTETDWPPLPEEFHGVVADTAAVKILLSLNQGGKANSLAQSAGGDIARLDKLLNLPRTRRQPKRTRAVLRTRGAAVFGWGARRR